MGLPFLVRQDTPERSRWASHERNQLFTIRPESVEGPDQSLLQELSALKGLMKLLIIPVLAVFGLLFNLVFATEIENPANLDYQLPADPNAEIIRFDSLGSMMPGQNPPALLTINADGWLMVSKAWTGTESLRMRLDNQELQALLRFIIAEKQFLRIQPAEIKQQMSDLQRRDGRLFAIADAATTLIAVDLPRHRHRVEFYAVDFAARQFPEIESLQHLRAIQNRLQALMDAAKNQPQ